MIVASTLGWVFIAGGLIGGIYRAVTGEFSPALTALLFVVVLAGCPFLFVWLKREWSDIKLPTNRLDDGPPTTGP